MGFPSAVFSLNPPHPTPPPQHPFNLWECLLLTIIVYVVYTLWMFLTMYIFNLSVTHSEFWHLLIFPIREAINRLCEAVPGGKGAWRKKVNLSMTISMNNFLHTCQIKNYQKDNPFRGVLNTSSHLNQIWREKSLLWYVSRNWLFFLTIY